MNKTNNSFSGLRFIACFCVFALHCYSMKMSHFAAWSVSLFFMMSGFLYGKQYANKEISWKNSNSFVWRKIKKLYPLYLCTSVLIIPYFLIKIGFRETLIQIIPYLLLTQSILECFHAVFVAAAWFISAIIILYFLTPTLICIGKWMFSNMNFFKIGLFCIIPLYILLIIYSYLICKYNWGTFWIYNFVFARVIEYFIAICLGIFTENTVGMNRLSSKKQGIISDVIMMIVFVVIVMLGFSFSMSQAYWRIVVWIIPNCLLLYFADKKVGFVNRLLSVKPLVWLGQLSFEIYLFHPVFLLYLTFWDEIWNISRVWRISCFCLTFVLTLFSSYLWSQIQKKLSLIRDR